MLASLLAAAGPFTSPTIDWHALSPEVVLVGTIVVVLLVDLFTEPAQKWLVSALAGLGLLGAMVPIITLAVDGGDRSMFGGAYRVDTFALVMKGVFIVAGYLTVLISTNYIAEGDYWEGEYYLLLVSAVLGMTVMASARDLISIFIALEMLSIPAYLLAGWKKTDLRGNEAGLKYYLMGVFASAVMLYGMSLIYGGTGETILYRIAESFQRTGYGSSSAATLGVVFILVGFGFKVSAVPFHNWAPDTYEGAPTPVTAFLSVASKAAGFVAILELIFIAFLGNSDIFGPLMWILAALTMTVGNLVALRQTNVVRLFAYSSVAQAGFMLAPLAVAGHAGNAKESITAVVVYLIVYTAMNLGAFAVIIAVSRRTKSGEIASWGGLGQYAPGLATSMSIFLFALAGIPPLGGWFAKFLVFRSVLQGNTSGGTVLAVIVGVNSVLALFYYANLVRTMWMVEPPDGDRTPVKVPAALVAAIGLSVVATLVIGFLPQVAAHLGDVASNLTALGR